jgi:hypothetical protein
LGGWCRWLDVRHVAECQGTARSAEACPMRLRGGKDIPIDMKIFYWLENQGGDVAGRKLRAVAVMVAFLESVPGTPGTQLAW